MTITLDNSDGRLPVDSPSVTVGRTVGLKKDEFFLGGKAVKKGDISAILEAAGFSRSNPYYVVPQGKVAQLADMDDACVARLASGPVVRDLLLPANRELGGAESSPRCMGSLRGAGACGTSVATRVCRAIHRYLLLISPQPEFASQRPPGAH